MKNTCTLIYKNPSDEIRGKTRRYLTEINPNVFTGALSAKVRDTLWDTIEKNNIIATITYPAKNEQGIMYKSTDPDARDGFINFDGVLLPCHKKDNITISNLYAKKNQHLLDHMLEAGSVAEALISYGPGYNAVKHFSKMFDIPRETLINFISFLCAMHDPGKAHPGFLWSMFTSKDGDGNLKISDKIEKLVLNGSICKSDSHIRHERYSKELIRDYFIKKGYDEIFSDEIATIAAYHHQGKATGKINDKTYKYKPEGKRWEDWENVQNKLIKEIEKRWTFSDEIKNLVEEDDICGFAYKKGINGFTYFILSVMVTGDWISSNSSWADYIAKEKDIKTAVKKFMKDNLLTHKPLAEWFDGVKWGQVYKFERNSLQEAIYSTRIGHADLLLMEYPCGCGKTAAAFLAALKQYSEMGGILLLTPTIATAKSAALDCRKDIIEPTKLDIPIPEFDSSMIWNNEDMENVPEELWSSRPRHQLFYPFAIGTVDQALKTVISHRYSCIGMLGIANKVVVIDEIHAYDAFMMTEIEALISWCRFLHVPVILLSATLPTKIKKRLFAAAGVKKSDMDKIDNAYPLLSAVTDRKLSQIPLTCEGRTVPVKCIKANDVTEWLAEKALEQEHGCNAYIAPTVKKTQELYERIQRGNPDCEVILLTGNDTYAEKKAKVDRLKFLLGKTRDHRPEKLIVVATSIIEQSMDIDFDRMYTSLAPIDLLIQRMGRVWRHDHKGTIREKEQVDDPFTIVIPSNVGHLVYDENILRETAKILDTIDKIDTIKDVRYLIDTVYQVEISKDNISRIKAGWNTLADPYLDEIVTLANSQEAYEKFSAHSPQTREMLYPTAQVIILEKLKDKYDYKEISYIKEHNMVSVPAYSIKHFTPVDTGMKCFDDNLVFVGENLKIEENGHTMSLTKEYGLRII